MTYESMNINTKIANQLSNYIVDALYNESANILADVCEGHGLAPGTAEEAFRSKKQYIYKRIKSLSKEETYKLALRLEGKYPDSDLDHFLSKIDTQDTLNVISKFDDIKSTILQEISKAQYIIRIAVARFTDNDLANALFKQKMNGVNIQIILNDDSINRQMLDSLSKHFEILRVPSHEPYKNLMHNKFCIIDFKTVLHGSYNWTKKAQYNDETISIIENRTHSLEYADQFIEIKKNLINKSRFIH